MASYPVAVLKFSWSDSPWTNNIPDQLRCSDAVINRLFLPFSWPGIASYWQQCSFGTIDLTGSQVFPWRKLNNMAAPTMAGQYGRGQLIAQAVQQAQAEGWPLDQFFGIVVWVAPSANNPQDSGSGPWRVQGKWPWAVLYEANNHDFYAHEFGHALGFEHTWGPRRRRNLLVLGVAPYSDPYCVMAAQSYLRTDPTFPMPADPNGPPKGDPYWNRMAPMPAAATLCQKVPDFAASSHVLKIGTITAKWQRSLTLRARDLPQGNDPVLAVVQGGPVTGARLAYLIELRRSHDWDRGLGVVAKQPLPSPSTGLVIHSLRNLDEYPNEVADTETNPKVVYEANFPLPLTGGDADWHSNTGEFVVRVNNIADDLSWVELTVGGADLRTAGAVTVDVVFGGSSELIEEGVEEDVSFICGRGNYHFWINHQHTQLTCTATAFGYDNPQFSWQVNGLTVSGATITVPVTATFPRPKSETKESRNATLTCARSANTLILTAEPKDGNYSLEIQATVTEGNPILNPTPPSSSKTFKKVDTILIGWEEKYYNDLQACIKRVHDINDRYAKSRFWPRFDLGDPLPRVRLVLDIMQRDLRDTNPILSEQLERAIEVFSQKPIR